MKQADFCLADYSKAFWGTITSEQRDPVKTEFWETKWFRSDGTERKAKMHINPMVGIEENTAGITTEGQNI